MSRRAGRQVAAAQQYYDVAMDVLARDGVAGLRIGPLCRALGVTSGSFYHHFGGWSGFVRGLLEFWETDQTDRVARLARATADPAERMRVIRELVTELRHDSDAAIRAWASTDPEVGRAQRRVDVQRRIALEQVVTDIVADPADARRLAVLGVALMAGYQQTCDPRDRDLMRALFDDYRRLVLSHAPSEGRPAAPPNE